MGHRGNPPSLPPARPRAVDVVQQTNRHVFGQEEEGSEQRPLTVHPSLTRPKVTWNRGQHSVVGQLSREESWQLQSGKKDFPSGPLDLYRKKASFSWKELALFWDGEEIIKVKHNVFRILENDPLFARQPGEDISVEKYRELTFLRCKRLFEYDFLTLADIVQDPLNGLAVVHCLGMYDWSLLSVYSLTKLMFGGTVLNSGSNRHHQFVEKVINMEIFGCFALTELSHGSNARAMRTTAKYDPETKEFIINSPDFEAAKFWIGNMGKTATHAVVFAQLETPNGVCQGLHSFIVQVVFASRLRQQYLAEGCSFAGTTKQQSLAEMQWFCEQGELAVSD
ncbi:peroxisomal acyl-coenzyme A oxidase 3-like [Rhincodon typus]|uniref:peroxisomal acyl-coenzyme A oxidase 3-like n=1 Tax=Rhincodon typus TaxID=259920 RepID=UPI00202F2B11|nr:peroxisomal acyl-coenzyme A oxidase 3-like [Rhincodon typus]